MTTEAYPEAKCPHCGAKNPVNADTCGECGKELDYKSQMRAAQRKEQTMALITNPFLIGLAVVILLSCGCAVYYFL